jgi:chromosomal replication initiation ATPase DnaA
MNVADIQSRITLSEPRPSARAIIHAVAQKHELTTHDLIGKDKCRHMAWARHEAFDRLYRKETHMSLPAIARMFDMDHTSVLYGIWAHRKRKDAREGH